MSDDFSSTQVAEKDSDMIYQLESKLASVLNTDWYDKEIFNLEKDNIQKIRFQYPSREFTIQKDEKDDEESEDSWQGILPYKFSVDNEKVFDILETLSSLRATEIPEQSFEGTGLEKNLQIIQLSGENIDVVLMVGEDNGEELYYTKKGDSDNIYLISSEEKEKIDIRISDLR